LSADRAKGEVTVREPSAAERTVARRAAEARATVPNLELSVATALERPPTDAALVRACALSLAEHPRANASYRDGRYELYSRVNVGLVVAEEDAYLIPTVFDADRKSLLELEAEIESVIARSLARELTAPAFTGATFTVWNASPFGISAAAIPPVPPQAAALAAGAPSDGAVTLTLACDHRILYGARAAEFLRDVSARLGRPDR
jgi:pyruvate dehydrogenase E2 component (dihydrolipoamide acetyltransferase)